MSRLLLVFAVAGSLNVAATVRAQTRFFNTSGLMVAYTNASSAEELAAIDNTGVAVYTRPGGVSAWTNFPMTGAPGVTFYSQTGFAKAEHPNGIRLYAVSISLPHDLWQYDTATSSWTDLGNGGFDLQSSPALDARYYPGFFNPPGVMAVLRGTSGRVYACFNDSTGTHWSEITAGANAVISSNVAVSTPTQYLPNDIEIYYVKNATTPVLHRYVYFAGTGADVSLGLTAPAQIEFSGSRILVKNTCCGAGTGTTLTFLVYPHSGVGDDVYDAFTTNGTAWLTSKINFTGPGTGAFSYAYNALYRTDMGGVDHIYATTQDGKTVYMCVPTTTSGGLRTCAPTTTNALPADLKPTRDTVGPALTAYHTASLQHYFTYGQMQPGGSNFPRYVYRADYSTAGWANWLAPRTAVAAIPHSSGAHEFSGDEYWGSLAFVDTFSRSVQRSYDDGNSWDPSPTQPLDSTDINLAFSVNANLYVLSAADTFKIVRETSTLPSMWTAPLQIANNFSDRGWLAADRKRNDTLYATWIPTTAGQGAAFAYCRGTSTCENASAWCPGAPSGGYSPFVGSACSGAWSSGCQVIATGEGTTGAVWLLVGVDPACPAGTDPHVFVGSIRKITNLTAMMAGCTQPLFSAPACVYYVGGHPEGNTAFNCGGVSCSGIQESPGIASHWGMRIVDNGDSTGDFGVVVYDYRDVNTAGDCGASSTKCRLDLEFLRYRNASGQWCTNGTCVNPARTLVAYGNGLHVNLDGPFGWEDHTYPILAGLNSATYGILWQDYRNSATNNTFNWGIRTIQYSSTSLSPTLSKELLTTETGPYVDDRDIDQPASAHLHAHFASKLNTAAIMVTWAPMNPPE